MERFSSFVDQFSDGQQRQRSDTSSVPANDLIDGVAGFRSLLEEFRGTTLRSGIYRFMDAELFAAATAFVCDAYPAWTDHTAPFGCDWLGRIFAVDGSGRTGADGEPCVLLLDPGTGDILKVPATVSQFHDQVLLFDREVALEESLWKAWSIGGVALDYDQVVGLRTPCFLGGELILDNLDIQRALVYWGLAGQLIAQTRHLREGTQIKSVVVE